jgi:hypothetical protein
LTLLIIVIAACVLSAPVLRRWWVVGVPLVLIPLYYVGLRYEWYGWGVGDAWQLVGAFVTLATLALTATAIVVSRAIGRLLRHPRAQTPG